MVRANEPSAVSHARVSTGSKSNSASNAVHPSLESTRRSYLGWLLGLCSAGVGVILSVPLLRFALYPLTGRPTEVKWSDLGPLTDFASVSAPVQRMVKVEQLDGWRKEVSDKVVYVLTIRKDSCECFPPFVPTLAVPYSGSLPNISLFVLATLRLFRVTERAWAARLPEPWMRSIRWHVTAA